MVCARAQYRGPKRTDVALRVDQSAGVRARTALWGWQLASAMGSRAVPFAVTSDKPVGLPRSTAPRNRPARPTDFRYFLTAR